MQQSMQRHIQRPSVTYQSRAGVATSLLHGQKRPQKRRILIGYMDGWGACVRQRTQKITASGPVYKLASVADFPGRYTQSTGKAGFSSSGSSDLWLENSAGVIMHRPGTRSGAMLTLGKDEIFIRMAK